MADASDYIFELEDGRKVNFRGARGDELPWLLQPYWATREDGVTALAFVTGQPADAREATSGPEIDADFVVLVPPQGLRWLAEGLTRQAEGLPPV